jgi:hypothetical protein
MMALSLALAACAEQADWTKQGVSADRASTDYSECRAEAQHDIQRDVNIDTDIAASMQQNWQRSQSTETHLAGDVSSNAKRSDDLLKGCMESKGYAPGGTEPSAGPHWWSFLSL